MTRIATLGNYQSALSDLMAAQTRAAEAQNRVATQKVATDLIGFGRQSETLTAMKGTQARLQGFIDTASSASARLTTQDLAMNQLNDSLGSLREAVGNALATESGLAFMQEVQSGFQGVVGALNFKHHGAYLFGGANTTQAPVSITNLADLAAAPSVSSVFTNDQLKSVSRVAEGTTLQTGVLGSELGTDALEVLRDIQAFNDGPLGPLTGKLTTAQKDFLTQQMNRLSQVSSGVIERIALTGAQAKQVETVGQANADQLSTLEQLVSDRTDADMAKAVTDLQLSQVAVQASAQVVAGLRDLSLLNYLR
jgi:Flagellin and related hook-associated proteins